MKTKSYKTGSLDLYRSNLFFSLLALRAHGARKGTESHLKWLFETEMRYS